MISGGIDRFQNIALLTEDNFNITPSDVEIWRGDIPYKEGDIFPTESQRNRANEYLTNYNLYINKFNGILDSVFSWNDYMVNPITNYPNLAICADLPDWYNTTESWVSIFSSPPEIDTIIDTDSSDFKTVSGHLSMLSSVLGNSNFAEVWHDVIRSAQIVYGNKIVRVDKTRDGGVRFNNLPAKCWQPFVNEDNTSEIECNVFFNIFNDEEYGQKCEFIAYVEDGTIIKKTFEYIGGDGSGRLGAQIGETITGKAFNGEKNISPIVVFKGRTIGGGIYGQSQYKYWDASISSAIRNYEAIGVLVEQAKELIRKIPSGATKTDEYTGVTYQRNTGAIAYTDNENPPEIEYIKCMVQLDQAINAYKESIARVSRDTGLPASFFDTRELNIAASGTALKSSMYRTELLSNAISNSMKLQVKQLISKIAAACGIDIGDTMWDVTIKSSVIIDKKEQSDIIQQRLSGDRPTISIAQAIKEYEGISISMAQKKALELEGKQPEENEDTGASIHAGTGDNTTSDSIEFTASENSEDYSEPMLEYPMGMMPM